MTRMPKERSEEGAARRLADHLNAVKAADYEIDRDGATDPPDVVLRSPSGRFPTLNLEIIRCPPEGGPALDHHGNVGRLERDVSESLKQRGVTHTAVTIHPQDLLFKKRPPQKVIQELIDLIAGQARTAPHRGEGITIDGPELWETAEEVSKYVGSLTIYSDLSAPEPTVGVSRGIFVPNDDRLLQKAIAQKRMKYSPGVLRDTVLLLDAQWAVDDQQIESYRETLPPGAADFKEIWIVGSLCRPACLRSQKT